MEIMISTQFDTILGTMVSITDEQNLYLVEFVDRLRLDGQMKRLEKGLGAEIVPGSTEVARVVKEEMNSYFARRLKQFKIPLFLVGSTFQKLVWEELKKIPHGKTVSYSAIAASIGKPEAFRAVATAIGSNPFAIVIPCHRVISADGGLGGYSGGLKRKEWLIRHEK